MILHIPHASTDILSYEIIDKEKELLKMTDHFTDELYSCDNATRIVFELSRLICDVERFEDDTQEPMSKYGMGVCYTKNSQGNKLRDFKYNEKNEVLKNYYHPHHKKLSDAVDEELHRTGSALIIDCHSFPNTTYYFNNDYGKTRPDICIGTDSYHTPEKLLENVQKFFLSKGYFVKINDPYSGTIVPLKHYKKEKNVSSIMIEVNRKIYMNEDGVKTKNFDILKNELIELLNNLQVMHLEK